MFVFIWISFFFLIFVLIKVNIWYVNNFFLILYFLTKIYIEFLFTLSQIVPICNSLAFIYFLINYIPEQLKKYQSLSKCCKIFFKHVQHESCMKCQLPIILLVLRYWIEWLNNLVYSIIMTSFFLLAYLSSVICPFPICLYFEFL